MAIGVQNNGVKIMDRYTTQREDYIISLNWLVPWLIREIENLSEEAAVAINEKEIVLLIIADALGNHDDKLIEGYANIMLQFEDFAIPRNQVFDLLYRAAKKLTRRLDDSGVLKGRRYRYVWYQTTRNLYLYEEY